jgi:hypothetical protein
MYKVAVKSTHRFDLSTVIESKKAPLIPASTRQDDVENPDDRAKE